MTTRPTSAIGTRSASSTTRCSPTAPFPCGSTGVCCLETTMANCSNKIDLPNAFIRVGVRSVWKAVREDPEVLGSACGRVRALRPRSREKAAVVPRDPVQGIGVVHHRLRQEGKGIEGREGVEGRKRVERHDG